MQEHLGKACIHQLLPQVNQLVVLANILQPANQVVVLVHACKSSNAVCMPYLSSVLFIVQTGKVTVDA
jgi:hypothetical protein